MQKAILFDIDGTLLKAPGLGRPAFAEAFEIAYGVEADFSQTSFVGATDTAVIRAMAQQHGILSTASKEEHFYLELTKRLDPRLAQGPLELTPGVQRFLEALCKRNYLLGIVTGNIRATAWSKLIHAGLAHYFTFGAYSTDHHDRNEIARIAVQRARTLKAHPCLLVGDTPKDVEAARAVHLPVLAIGAGWLDPEILHAAGADAFLKDFTDLDVALQHIEEVCKYD